MADDELLLPTPDAARIPTGGEQSPDDSHVMRNAQPCIGASFAGSPLVAALAQAVIDAHAKAALDDVEDEAVAGTPATSEPVQSRGLILIQGGHAKEGD